MTTRPLSRIHFQSVVLLLLCAGILLTTAAQAHSTLSDITQDGEERISLPLVPESKLLIHATSGIDKKTGDGTVQSLPLAVLLTRMAPEEVVAWYREQLPAFTVLTDDESGDAQILESAGSDTRIDGPATYQIPNIRIRPTDARMATHMKGARTMLQVYYRPEEESVKTADSGS